MITCPIVNSAETSTCIEVLRQYYEWKGKGMNIAPLQNGYILLKLNQHIMR